MPWVTATTMHFISGGAEPGERHGLTEGIDLYGWNGKPEPRTFELKLLDVWDADRKTFMNHFGREICPTIEAGAGE